MGKKPTLLSKVADKIMSIDLYGESTAFTVNGSASYPSFCGTIMSLIVFLVVLPYGINKYTIM